VFEVVHFCWSGVSGRELSLVQMALRPPLSGAAAVMGGLTHRQGMSTLPDTLTSKLVDALECGFLLVKRDSRRLGSEVHLLRDLAGTSARDPRAAGAQTGRAGCGPSWPGS